MNITLICHVYPPEHVTAGIMVRELAEDLAADHRVTVLTGWPSHPRGVLFQGWRTRFRHVEYDDKGFRVIRCGHSIRPRGNMLWRLWYYLTFGLSTLVNGLASGPVDAVYNDSSPIFGTFLAWVLARCKRARMVYMIMDLFPESAVNAGLLREGRLFRAFRAMDRFLCDRSRCVLALSEHLKRGIAARGTDPAKIEVTPFWLDPKTVRPGDRDNPWRRTQGIAADKFVAMYAGTIGYVSGAEILIDTAKFLGHRDDILLLVVGEGPVKRKVQTLSEQLGLPNIRFLPFQPAEALSDMQATADVGLVTLLPETGETSVPSKVLGYMAAGRAVVASVRDDSPTAEMVRAAEGGIITPAQNPAALAEAIEYAADNPEPIQTMGRNARAFFLKHFSRDNCTKRLEALLAATDS